MQKVSIAAQASPSSTHSPATAMPARSSRHPMLRLWDIVAPIRGRLLLGLICALGSSILALMIPRVLERMLNSGLAPGAPATIVWVAGALALGLGILEASLMYLRRVFAVSPSTAVERDMRVRLYRKVQDMPVVFHDEWGSGQLLSRSMSDMNLIRRWIAFGMIMAVTTTVTVIVGVGLLIWASPLLALIFVAAALPMGILTYRFTRTFAVLSRLSQDQNGDLATTIEQSVQGIRVLKAFGRGPRALEQFTHQAGELRGTEIRKASAIARFDMMIFGLPEIATSLSLLAGLYLTANGHMNLGELSAYFVTAVVVIGPVRMMGSLFGMFVNTRTALDRYFEVMDAPNTITDPPHRGSHTDADGPGQPRIGEGDDGIGVEFRDVHFRYPDAPERVGDVLSGVNLTITPGETMALVGVTGSGKSTLVQLAARLYDVTGGQVLLGGHDVRDLPLTNVHEVTAVAFEDATLFSDTVRENVLLGAHGTEDEREELLARALEAADATFVYDLPQGVLTRVGEEGLSLSGGQRQRLALARAIAARPRVLLLDDPLSALDTRTEERVSERLREILRETTTLIVAHRTSTVALADRVALLDDGKILAVGTHEQLLHSHERYREVIATHEAERRGNQRFGGHQ